MHFPHRTRGNRDFILKGCTQNLKCTGTKRKNNNFIGAWTWPTCWSWRASWEGRGGKRGSLPWEQRHLCQRYQGVFIGMNSPGSQHIGSLAPRHGPIQQPVLLTWRRWIFLIRDIHWHLIVVAISTALIAVKLITSSYIFGHLAILFSKWLAPVPCLFFIVFFFVFFLFIYRTLYSRSEKAMAPHSSTLA